MKAVLKGLFLSCVLVALTGCAGMNGRWLMESVTPESAEKEFALKCMCLMDDGSFMACAKEGKEMKMLKGTYKYDASAKTLAFTSPEGKERQYNAELVESGGKMKVWGSEKGKEWTAMMKRGKPCPKDCCAAGKMCPMMKKEEAGKSEPKKAEAKKVEPKKAEPSKTEAKKGTEPKPTEPK